MQGLRKQWTATHQAGRRIFDTEKMSPKSSGKRFILDLF